MKGDVKIGVICLARTTFDFGAAKEIYDEKKTVLQQMESVDWVFWDDLVIEADQAKDACRKLAQSEVNGVVVISGTFHLGHLALMVNDLVRKPMLLWAFPELPYDGGKIRLNSVCGVNLNASNLYKAGVDSYVCCLGSEIDAAWVDALRMKAALSGAHVGIAGYRAHGFFNLSVEDLQEYRNFGILIDHYELADVMGKCDGQPLKEEIACKYDCSCITGEQTEKVGALASSMEAFIKKNSLDALAVRCWPEFADSFGVAPCAAMSYLAGEGYILGCEGDVEGTLSLLGAKAACGGKPFLADLSQVDINEDFALMWHCGVASPDLWDGESEKTLDTYFAGGRGVTADFVMKSGRVSVMRLDTARGRTRLFISAGEAIPMKKDLKGTYAKVRFDKHIAELLDTVTKKGIAHHVAMVYGDHTDAFKKFARICGFEIIE